MTTDILFSKNIKLTALTAGVICLLVYLRALSCDFVNLDDPFFVVNNEAIRHLDARFFSWAFLTTTVDMWMPLTWVSFAIDYQLWGLNPMGYHLTNILLHAANTSIVVFVAHMFFRSTGAENSASSGNEIPYHGMLLLAGLLFGIHPMRVESVAWVTERKDVLNGLFTLGAVLCYLCYARQKGGGGAKGITSRIYLLSLVLFALSLMAKPVSVVLPVMLLLADWFPLGRLRKETLAPLLVEKIPYFVLSLGIAIVTLYLYSQKQLLLAYTDLSFGARLVLSGNAIFEYSRLQLLPVGILPVYVFDGIVPVFTLKAFVVAVITGLCLYAGKKRRSVTVTWLGFVIPLLPVLAFFQNGDQAFAARYTYLPSVVPGIAAAALMGRGFAFLKKSGHAALPVVYGLLLVSLTVSYGAITLGLINVWRNTGTLWSRVIEHRPLGRAYSDRGVYYLRTGKSAAAVDDFSEAIKIASSTGKQLIYNLYAFRGVALGDLGRHEEAIEDFNTAISMFPHPVYYHYRALALQTLGRLPEAERDFLQAGPTPGEIDWM